MHWHEIYYAAFQINQQIRKLKKQRQELLEQDAEYARYLSEFYSTERQSEPLGLRPFHILYEELKHINTACPIRSSDAEFDNWLTKHETRLQELEELLFA